MDSIDIKYLEHRLGNGDSITLSRDEFSKLAYGDLKEISELKSSLNHYQVENQDLEDKNEELRSENENLIEKVKKLESNIKEKNNE